MAAHEFRIGRLSIATVTRWMLATMVFAVSAAAAVRQSAPYVSTVEQDVELMLDLAGVVPGDYVIDLGSGDGRIVIAAARRGAVSHGIEIDPELVALSRANAIEAGVADRAAFFEADIFEADIAHASVVTVYLFPEVNIALREKLLAELAPGTRVISNSFDMGDWQPDAHDMSARSSGGLLLWIVPADVAGEWALEIEEEGKWYTVRIEQRYQDVDVQFAEGRAAAERESPRTKVEVDSGRAEAGGSAHGNTGTDWALSGVTLRGERLSFLAADEDLSYFFVGRINGDTMEGYVQIRDRHGERLRSWRAVAKGE